MNGAPYWSLRLDSQSGTLSPDDPILHWQSTGVAPLAITVHGPIKQNDHARLLCPDGRVLDGRRVFESLFDANAADFRAARIREAAAPYSESRRRQAEEYAAAVEREQPAGEKGSR